MGRQVHRPVLDRPARRVLAEEVVALPVLRRPDRPGGKPSAAVGADVAQQGLGTGGAVRAFVGADPRLRRVGRQGLVAVLTGGPQFQHRMLPLWSATRSTG